MTSSTTSELDGSRGRITVRRWAHDSPSHVVVLTHGLGEHTGRYEHVAASLVDGGADVVAPDHWGHGLSEGEPGLVDDVESIVTDVEAVADGQQARYPGLPLVVVGHSLGGLIATRYIQRNPGKATALVLSGPVIGGNDALLGLLDLPEIPDVPIDPGVLSRDPAVGEAYANDPLVYHGPLHRGTLEGVKAAVDAVAEGDALGDLPTLWIHGGDDALVPLPETRRAFDIIGGSGLETTIYDGAKHEIFNETNAEEVLGDVRSFINRALADAT